ncbi:MAG: diguanylate cyclase [Alphaproteobacteria bacterium]
MQAELSAAVDATAARAVRADPAEGDTATTDAARALPPTPDAAQHGGGLKRLPIRARLALIAGMMLVALVAVSVIAWQALEQETAAATAVVRLSHAQSLHQDADMMHEGLKGDVYELLVRTADPEASGRVRDRLRDNAARFRGNLSSLSAFAFPADLAASVAETRRQAELYIHEAEAVAQIANLDPELGLAALSGFESRFETVKRAMDAQTDLLAAEIAATEQASERSAANARLWIVLAGCCAAVIAAVTVHLINASIRRSLRDVGAIATRIEEGDLAARCTIASNDEIGALGHAINGMAANLEMTIGRMRADSAREAFNHQLAEALEMVHTEYEAYGIVGRAMNAMSDSHPMELLLSDSSESHLEQATAHPTAGAPGCNVDLPFNCVAVCRGTAMSFPDSEALNACPKLRGRPAGRISATCVPVTFMGRAVGVLHASGPVDRPLAAEQADRLSILGGLTGARIGTIRAFQQTQVQASTDSLTGLLNRRALEQQMRALTNQGTDFAYILADLDRFKLLNDTHGHQAGDTALRVFSEVMRSNTRDGDLIARLGGEEFAVILAGSSAVQARDWTERLRQRLAKKLSEGKCVAFTASFGIADSSMTRNLDELQAIADVALYVSKDEGRDRITLGDAGSLTKPSPRHAPEHPAGINVRLLANAKD